MKVDAATIVGIRLIVSACHLAMTPTISSHMMSDLSFLLLAVVDELTGAIPSRSKESSSKMLYRLTSIS